MKQQGSKPDLVNRAASLAQELNEALVRERLVPRFVDSYVVEYGRYGLQVHASLYRDLLTLLQREALLAMSAHALELIAQGSAAAERKSKAAPLSRKEAAAFRQRFLAALGRQQRWNAGAALEFQSDLQMYEKILAKASTRRCRKPFEVANHPFVDRGGFLLDSSFLENARLAASRALTGLEELTAQVTHAVLYPSVASKAAKQT